MIKLGDKVRFLNENLEGFVTSMIGKGIIGVTVDSDFEIPVQESQVVKIQFAEKAGNNSEAAVQEKPRKQNSHPLGVFIAFERINDNDVQAWFHNNFTEKVLLAVYEIEQGVYKFRQNFVIEREDTVAFKKYKMEDFQNWLPLYVQLISIELNTVKPVAPIAKELPFYAKSFHQTLKFSFFLNKQAYQYRIDEQELNLNLQKLKEKDFSEKVSVAPDLKSRPEELIDLHYDALLNNGFPAAKDVVSFQMDVFVQSLEAAYMHKMPRIVFIHGIGNLYLKNKIQTWLSKHKDLVKEFRDADPIQFGGGATEVFMKI
jgi:hypothetical protein